MWPRVRVSVPSRASARARRSQRGAVTAETAMVLPLLAAFAIGLTWLVTLAVMQVRAVDAARETARALARDDPEAAAVDLGRRTAPTGASFEIRHDGDRVVVVVTSTIDGPGGLFRHLPGATVRAEAVAATEDQP